MWSRSRSFLRQKLQRSTIPSTIPLQRTCMIIDLFFKFLYRCTIVNILKTNVKVRMRLQAWTSPPFRPSMRTRPPPRSSMRALQWIGGGSCSGGSSSSSGGSGSGIGGKSSTGRSSSRCRFGGRVLGDGVQVRGVHAGGDCSSEARSSEACHSTQCTGWQIMFYKNQKSKKQNSVHRLAAQARKSERG